MIDRKNVSSHVTKILEPRVSKVIVGKNIRAITLSQIPDPYFQRLFDLKVSNWGDLQEYLDCSDDDCEGCEGCDTDIGETCGNGDRTCEYCCDTVPD